MNPPRKKICASTETELLVNCRRRCCLCVFLEGNTDVRAGQIAHMDHNRSNNKPDNLVWLCFEHHNQYDSKTSQAKNITASELKLYKSDLQKLIQKQDLYLTFYSSNDITSPNKTQHQSSAHLVGSILEAYDRELRELGYGNKPNAIKLLSLAKAAATVEGDFFAARQAFLSALRLGGECEKRGMQREGLRDPVHTSSATSAAENILECFSQIDFVLFTSAIREARELSLRGDVAFIDYEPSQHGASPVYFVFAQLLCRLGRKLTKPEELTAAKTVGRALGSLTLSVAMMLELSGISMPEPPDVIYINVSGNRVVPDGVDKHLEILFWAVSRIAYLPEMAYQAALEGLSFVLATGNVLVNKQDGFDADRMTEFLRKWMVFPGHAIICIEVKSKKDVKPVEAFIAAGKATGEKVATAVKAFVQKERTLVLKNTAA